MLIDMFFKDNDGFILCQNYLESIKCINSAQIPKRKYLLAQCHRKCLFFQVSELLKLGGDNYENMKQFSVTVEEKLFRMSAHRDRALTYKTEEVQLTAVDEVYVEQDKSGHVVKHVCRVRVFFLSFLSGKFAHSTILLDTDKL